MGDTHLPQLDMMQSSSLTEREKNIPAADGCFLMWRDYMDLGRTLSQLLQHHDGAQAADVHGTPTEGFTRADSSSSVSSTSASSSRDLRPRGTPADSADKTERRRWCTWVTDWKPETAGSSARSWGAMCVRSAPRPETGRTPATTVRGETHRRPATRESLDSVCVRRLLWECVQKQKKVVYKLITS